MSPLSIHAQDPKPAIVAKCSVRWQKSYPITVRTPLQFRFAPIEGWILMHPPSLFLIQIKDGYPRLPCAFNQPGDRRDGVSSAW